MPHVLIVDRSDRIRALLAEALTKQGFGATAVATAAKGVEAMGRRRPDVVLMELEMPGEGGPGCLREIRADPATAHLPVLMLTAQPAKKLVLRAAQLGVQGVIIKDSHLAVEVVERVRRLLGKQAQETPAAPPPAAGKSAPAGAPRPVTAALSEPKIPAPISAAEDEESLRASELQMQGDGLEIDLAMVELKRLKPLMTRSELLERVVEGADLRAIKPAVQQVLTLTGSASASIDSIARAIKQDQALSVKVLKVANSPLYTRGERVETVQKAVTRIGVAQIRTTVLSLSMVDRFESVGLGDRVRPDWFWEHSIACGLIASRIAQVRGLKSEAMDAMFTAGLLHDVGRSLYAERLADEYAGVIKVADQLEMPLETVESRLLLINHADLTDRVLRQWNFSTDLVNPIALHHLSVGNIRRVAPRMAESVATLGLANRLAHALLLGCSGNEAVYPVEEFVQFLSLTGEQVRTLCAAVPEQTQDLKLQMLSHGGSATGDSLVVEARKSLPVQPRPLVVGLNPSADAVGILLERLASGPGAGGPNLAVVRVTAAGERAQVQSMLRSAEERAGAKNLPTLVVASGVACRFADGVLGDRPVEQVVIPLRLTRLLRAVNRLLGAGQPAARK